MTKLENWLLRFSAVLWVIWGLVHVLAGVMTMAQDTTGAVAGIADAVDPGLLANDYHAAVGALLNQHGFNLAWIGATTTVSAAWIWRGSGFAIFLAALVGGLADVGYFVFMDLGGFVNFVPGTVMTFVSSAAIVTSLAAWFRGKRAPSTGIE